jgi:glycosyltransferase involved in cell wall biosynthesis
MLSNLPLVSILINNYNYENFIENAIRSSLNQTYDNIEVIVVDDGSTDASCERIQRYENDVIPIYKENGGQASAFNAGFAVSQGEIIVFLDSDDVFLVEKIQTIVEIFVRYPKIGWCFHPLTFVDEYHKTIKVNHFTGDSGLYDVTNAMKRGKLRGKLPFEGPATSAMCFRRSCLEEILPMSESIKITSDDYIKYAALGNYPGYIILNELALQTIHQNNAYTFRTDKQHVMARVNIITAYWLYLNYPNLKIFAQNLFASGLCQYSKLSKPEAESREWINSFFDLMTLLGKVRVYYKFLYYTIRWRRL